jgi:hypothetical protein
LEERAEHRRLYNRLVDEVRRTGEILQIHGMESTEFLEADSAVGAIRRHIIELVGDTSSHLMNLEFVATQPMQPTQETELFSYIDWLARRPSVSRGFSFRLLPATEAGSDSQ